MQIELLSPAKNLEYGIEAINHGADAVYIGAPAFGARLAAGNSIEEIEQLVTYAHRYKCKVFSTVNTLLFDNEIPPALEMIRKLYNIGVDALIIQDLGLLECDLPPIELHASTQTHNASVERIRFLDNVGFKRIILARESSLDDMKNYRQQCNAELEAFIHGALCVSYSGQCYMSQFLNERSGNRGCCGQPCRSTYDLYNANKQLLRRNEHLLSLRDFSAHQHIESMIDAGITSFKIEGRLKDISYLKNVTAFYRNIIDNILNGRNDLNKSSSGSCIHYFTPDIERTFNRGFCDYFLTGRQKMASFATQKSKGKKVGTVSNVNKKSITVSGNFQFSKGDGICYIDKNKQLQGFNINQVEGNIIYPNKMPEISVGTQLWRNLDFAFDKLLQKKSAERKIDVTIILSEHENGFNLIVTDEDGISGNASTSCPKEHSANTKSTNENIEKQLSKLGNTAYTAKRITINTLDNYFIPTSLLNNLRRDAIEDLDNKRITHYKPHPSPITTNAFPYFSNKLDYSANIINEKSASFYKRHGVECFEYGPEKTYSYDNCALMTTKYCLRYELGQCTKIGNNDPRFTQPLFLRNNNNWFELKFDCKECVMRIKKAKPLIN